MMKFKNFEGIQYTVNYNKPPLRLRASGLCDNPDIKNPQIGLILVLMIFFAVLIPFLFYFTVKEVLKYLTKR
jgi:hypothetical protein